MWQTATGLNGVPYFSALSLCPLPIALSHILSPFLLPLKADFLQRCESSQVDAPDPACPHLPAKMSSLQPEPMFDVLRTTANRLRERLDEGSIDSVQIVKVYLDQIQRHNTQGAKCRAVISTPPRIQLISCAAKLDQERRRGSLRGPLHGIPILIKVSMHKWNY